MLCTCQGSLRPIICSVVDVKTLHKGQRSPELFAIPNNVILTRGNTWVLGLLLFSNVSGQSWMERSKDKMKGLLYITVVAALLGKYMIGWHYYCDRRTTKGW